MIQIPLIPSNIQAILWDMDGVLVNSEELWEDLYPDFLKDEFGVDNFRKSDFQLIIGKSIPAIYASLCEEDEVLKKITVDDFVRAEKSVGHQNIYPRTVMYDGCRKFLEDCKAQGLKMGIVSSSPMEWIESCLERHDLSDYFEILVSGYQENLSKPDPEIYLRGAKRIDVDPGNCLVIEDSPSGVVAGKGAGMTVWGFRNGSNDDADLRLADRGFREFMIDIFS